MTANREDDDKNKSTKEQGYGVFKSFRANVLRPCYHSFKKVAPGPAWWIKSNMLRIWSRLKNTDHQHMLFIKGTANYKNKLLIDVTAITEHDAKTGIQRVTREVSRELIKQGAILVRDWEGKLITNRKFYADLMGKQFDGIEHVIELDNNNLFLLDASWNRAKDFSNIISSINKHNGKAYSFVHDIIPILYPELITSDEMKREFYAWHEMLIKKCNGIICNSHATAKGVKWLRDKFNITNRKDLHIYGTFLGSDFGSENNDRKLVIRDMLERFANDDNTATIFLMVGTVEPRKGYLVALSAIENMLRAGENVKLLIIGHNGWKNDDFINKLHANSLYGERILWIDDGTDQELKWCYQNTSALIAASKDEGYGLPLVEAGHYGLPIICSDIPIFREVAGENAAYFKEGDAADLNKILVEWGKTSEHPDSKKIKTYTWNQLGIEIVNIINNKNQADYTL